MERGFDRIVRSKKAINLPEVKSRNRNCVSSTPATTWNMKSALSRTARQLRPVARSLSTSTARRAAKDEKAPPPPEDTTVAGRSPFAAFVEVLRDEVRKSREFNESVKQLAGERDRVVDSEAMKRAREVYERARVHHPLHPSAQRPLPSPPFRSSSPTIFHFSVAPSRVAATSRKAPRTLQQSSQRLAQPRNEN